VGMVVGICRRHERIGAEDSGILIRFTMKRIILASTSPRRKELLSSIGVRFEVDPGEYEEDMGLDLDPPALARFLSLEKAKSVAGRHDNALIIAADTFIVFKNRLLGKPRDAREAGEMLKMLSGRSHSVITGFTILDAGTGKRISKAVETEVWFKRLTDEEIAAYVRTKEPLDKAGAYAIQGLGAFFIRKIDGDYFNVIGLPLSALTDGLKKFGIHIL
jgi:septum formation protein